MNPEPPIWDNPCRDCQHWYRCVERSRAMLCSSYISQTGEEPKKRKTQHSPYKTHHDALLLQDRKEEE